MKTVRDLLAQGTVTEANVMRTIGWMLGNRDLCIAYNNDLGLCRQSDIKVPRLEDLSPETVAVLREVVLSATVNGH